MLLMHGAERCRSAEQPGDEEESVLGDSDNTEGSGTEEEPLSPEEVAAEQRAERHGRLQHERTKRTKDILAEWARFLTRPSDKEGYSKFCQADRNSVGRSGRPGLPTRPRSHSLPPRSVVIVDASRIPTSHPGPHRCPAMFNSTKA